MSLTPPSEMGGAEKVGAGFLGVGVLALLVAFLANWQVGQSLTLLFAGAGLVSGGILLSKKVERQKPLAFLLLYAGLVGLLLFIVKDGNLALGISGLVGAGVLALLTARDKSKHRVPAIILMAIVGTVGLALMATGQKLEGWALSGLVFGSLAIGGVVYSAGAFGGTAGIKNNGIFHSSLYRKGGTLSWIFAILMTGFYVLLYWFPEGLHGAIAAADPIQRAITGSPGIYYGPDGNVTGYNQWFLYGFVYTVAVLVMGFRYYMKYRHSKYQIIRTLSVSFFQLVFAFTIPMLLANLNNTQKQNFDKQLTAYNEAVAAGQTANYQAVVDAYPTVKEHYFHYFWPLGYSNLMPDNINDYVGQGGADTPEAGKPAEAWMVQKKGYGSFGLFAILFSLGMSLVGVVVLTYFFGKRWYCSFVCGCGGLAETAGDPFRQMSDKSMKAWRVERILIYSVLVLVTLMTALLLIDWKAHILPGHIGYGMKTAYGFLISQSFAGVVGTGFYPIMGSRVWCRFGCPQAAILGILQKYFSRFRITTNGGQCISCGNCSTYCEMGIDVKSYAQRGENIVRASCVGCGVCSAVCPRGVLNLENGPIGNRSNGGGPISISRDEVNVIA